MGGWFELNDAKVSSIDPANVICAGAYLLFYARRGIDKLQLEEVFPRLRDSVATDLEKVREAISQVSGMAGEAPLMSRLVRCGGRSFFNSQACHLM